MYFVYFVVRRLPFELPKLETSVSRPTAGCQPFTSSATWPPLPARRAAGGRRRRRPAATGEWAARARRTACRVLHAADFQGQVPFDPFQFEISFVLELGDANFELPLAVVAQHLHLDRLDPRIHLFVLLERFDLLVEIALGLLAGLLEFVDEAITAAEAGGAISPEIWVVRADLIRMTSDVDQGTAEGLYEQAQAESLEMGLRLTELKAVGRLVQLRREQGRSPDGTDELARVYDAFTEGLGERDLVAAKTILDG